jgi:hypothetical protein
MGKPLGLGSIRIDPSLHLVDRKQRYGRLLARDGTAETGAIATEEVARVEERARNDFGRAVLSHAAAAEGNSDANPKDLWEIPRLKQLAAMLEWDNAPSPERTGYRRSGDAEDRVPRWWRERPVLPDPVGVSGGTHSGSGSSSGSGRPDLSPSRKDQFKPRDRVRVVVLEEKTKKGKWRFQVKGSITPGVLHPQSAEPPDLAPGQELEMIVKAPGDTLQLEWLGGESR